MLSGSHGWRRLIQPVTGQAGAAFLGGSGITQAAADRFRFPVRGETFWLVTTQGTEYSVSHSRKSSSEGSRVVEESRFKEHEDDEGDGR
ncbi:hypothetical protein BO86DRAFT_386393 [Aspergillus japonicus CBS 114.51]|uniref:Uncharacterized protein n=1 Tax=Aspergillus japonicus CBS 114.51 TaxID=1448312 RepID=A0A8T8XC92_ASPJA|nr:hypothetical protein BO86DRAFT_386393 [Aspergillus japonicus CBS 114.51]RAH85454.1 hypothetical protein BO86DRAFT_386393 [Aspergillus japonicus CBS 114.51]